MSNEIRAQIDSILKDCEVVFSAVYKGMTKRDDWKCDEWSIVLQIRDGAMGYEEFQFFTGLGLRQPPEEFLARQLRRQYGRFTESRPEWLKECKPVIPHAADVLYSLILDANANLIMFDQWCDDFGYNTDSRKDLATYEACQENGRKLLRVFNHATVNAIREVLRDY